MSIWSEARSLTMRVPSEKEARWDSNSAVSTGNYYELLACSGECTFLFVRREVAFCSHIDRSSTFPRRELRR